MQRIAVRLVFFSTWSDGLRDAGPYLAELPGRDLGPRIVRPDDPDLARMARLDADWDGECLCAFAAMSDASIEVRSAFVADSRGILEFLARGHDDGAASWLILIGQRPEMMAPVVGRLLAAFTAEGGRVLYWSYDEASRFMPCFADDVAPYLSVLIHDESPLADHVLARHRSDCARLHVSWMANVVPFAHAFRERTEPRVAFVGSRLGLTDARLRQLDALREHFGPRLVAITDHSLPIADRGRLGAVRAHLCPEGRRFTTAAMRLTHTDRPFWAGCLGQVPVVEDSRWGGRLESLHAAGCILRYPHGDVDGMVRACEAAVETSVERRRDIYDHFNRYGTVGQFAAGQIVAYERAATRSRRSA